MFNADGSEAEMCGNGVRCVAKYVYDHGIAAKADADDRNRPRRADAGTGGRAAARCGRCASTWASRSWKPSASRRRCPAIRRWRCRCRRSRSARDLRVDGQSALRRLRRRDHRRLVLGIGPQVESDPAFPRRVNVEFVASQSARRRDHARLGTRLRRDAGLRHRGLRGVRGRRADRPHAAPASRPTCPAAILQLHWSETDNHVYMTGPAVEVFSGEWPD